MFKKEFAKVATIKGIKRLEMKLNEDGKYSIEVALNGMTKKYELTERQWNYLMDTETVSKRTGEKMHYNYQKTVYFDKDGNSVPKSQSVRTLECYFYKKFSTKENAEKEYNLLLKSLVKDGIAIKPEEKKAEVKKPDFSKMKKADLVAFLEANYAYFAK